MVENLALRAKSIIIIEMNGENDNVYQLFLLKTRRLETGKCKYCVGKSLFASHNLMFVGNGEEKEGR